MDLKKDLVKNEATLEEVVTLKKLKNVKANDKNLLESRLLTRMAKAFIPDEGRLEKINKIALATLKAEDVVVITIKAAGSQIDRGDDQFQVKALEKMGFKAIKNEIPLLLSKERKDHNWMSIFTLGTVFDAYVKDGELFYEAYITKTNKNLDDLEMVLAGHYKKVSVGFSMSPADYLCSACDIPIVSKDCPHYPGEDGIYAKINDIEDNYEISIVAVPMQAEAQIMQSSMSQEDEISGTDKINNDTIEDSTLMEDNKKEETPKVEVEVKIDPVAEALLKAIQALTATTQGVADSIKAMDSKLDNLNVKTTEEPAKEESKVEEVKSAEQPKKEEKELVTTSSKAANPPAHERLNTKDNVAFQKTANDLLWERLTLPND